MRTLKDQWSVWRAIVRFEDDPNSSKERPVIILDDRTALCLSLKVTSKVKNDRYHVKLEQWEAAGLTRPSWVDISKIITLQEGDFVKEIGKLDIVDITAIVRRLRFY